MCLAGGRRRSARRLCRGCAPGGIRNEPGARTSVRRSDSHADRSCRRHRYPGSGSCRIGSRRRSRSFVRRRRQGVHERESDRGCCAAGGRKDHRLRRLFQLGRTKLGLVPCTLQPRRVARFHLRLRRQGRNATTSSGHRISRSRPRPSPRGASRSIARHRPEEPRDREERECLVRE